MSDVDFRIDRRAFAVVTFAENARTSRPLPDWRRAFTLGRRPRARSACHRSHFACSVSQICASQRVSPSKRSAVSALTARRALTMAFSR